MEIYNIFDTEKLLNRAPDAMITKTAGLSGIAYWINRHYNLPDGKKLDKRDPLVLALKSWVDEEYDGGRQTALTNEELESKSLTLAGQLADGDEYAFLLARASKEQK